MTSPRPTMQLKDGISELLGANHPSIWKLIEGQRKEQATNEMTIVQYISGHQPAAGRRIY